MAYSDGVPNGSITNHKIGENLKWVYDGHTMTKEELATLRTEAEARKKERAKELKAKQEASAKRAYGIWKNAKPASDHPYLQRKGIGNHDNLIKMNQETGQIFVPVQSIEGKLQSLQIIDKDGNKRFLEDGKMEGGMLQLGKPSKDLIIAEGFATAKSIHDATGLQAIVAFSAHQIKNVAEAIHNKYPYKSLIIASDNDKVGLQKAQETAEIVPCKVIVPSFNKTELAQGFTDFNDLGSSRGMQEVKRQFEKALEHPKTKEKELSL